MDYERDCVVSSVSASILAAQMSMDMSSVRLFLFFKSLVTVFYSTTNPPPQSAIACIRSSTRVVHACLIRFLCCSLSLQIQVARQIETLLSARRMHRRYEKKIIMLLRKVKDINTVIQNIPMYLCFGRPIY